MVKISKQKVRGDIFTCISTSVVKISCRYRLLLLATLEGETLHSPFFCTTRLRIFLLLIRVCLYLQESTPLLSGGAMPHTSAPHHYYILNALLEGTQVIKGVLL